MTYAKLKDTVALMASRRIRRLAASTVAALALSRSRGALAALALMLIATGCGADTRPSASRPAESGEVPPQPEPGWHQVAQSPLTARHSAHAFWTGDRVLVIGGTDARPCPPNADCALPEVAPLRDGASLDPSSGIWMPMADAPVPLGLLSGAVVDGTLYLWLPGFERAPGVRSAFLAYSIEEDRWEELPSPPVRREAVLDLVAAGSKLVANHGTQESGVLPDLLYDPVPGEWRELPPDPLAPSFDRSMVWADDELVLLGVQVVPNPGSERPSLYRAAALDLATNTWRRLPDSEVVGWNPAWYGADGRVINASIGSADGGQVNNWGRSYPFGGMLDATSGDWSPLPDPPIEPGPYQGLSAAGETHIVSTEGWVLDVAGESWRPLDRPPGGAEQGEAAVWAGDRLMVWGGVRWNGVEPTLLDVGWAWLP